MIYARYSSDEIRYERGSKCHCVTQTTLDEQLAPREDKFEEEVTFVIHKYYTHYMCTIPYFTNRILGSHNPTGFPQSMSYCTRTQTASTQVRWRSSLSYVPFLPCLNLCLRMLNDLILEWRDSCLFFALPSHCFTSLEWPSRVIVTLSIPEYPESPIDFFPVRKKKVRFVSLPIDSARNELTFGQHKVQSISVTILHGGFLCSTSVHSAVVHLAVSYFQVYLRLYRT